MAGERTHLLHQRRPRRRGSRRGFTLAEVLVTLVFLGIALPAVLRAVTLAERSASVAKRIAQATVLAESELNELMTLSLYGGESESGDFSPDFPGYVYEWQAFQPGEFEELQYLLEVDVQVSWQQGNDMRSVTIKGLYYDPRQPAQDSQNGQNGLILAGPDIGLLTNGIPNTNSVTGAITISP
jgi:prepilin-type N-terminal cleavage/methylation domain-containing protein